MGYKNDTFMRDAEIAGKYKSQLFKSNFYVLNKCWIALLRLQAKDDYVFRFSFFFH